MLAGERTFVPDRDLATRSALTNKLDGLRWAALALGWREVDVTQAMLDYAVKEMALTARDPATLEQRISEARSRAQAACG
jgi:hypothetical protein